MIFFIARRYLSARNKPLFTPFFLFICLTGVAVGVFALIFVLAVMEGFESDFQKRVIGFKAPLVATAADPALLRDLKKQIPGWVPEVQSTRFFVEGEGILQKDEGETVGVRVRGLEDPHEMGDRFGKISESEPLSRKNIFLGEELAASVRILPDFFEKVRLIFPLGEVGPGGELLPRVRRYTVSGTFRSGFYDFDSKYLLMDVDEAVSLFGEFSRFGLEIWVDPGRVMEVESLLARRLPAGVKLESWRQQNPKLFSAMKLERIGMFLLLSIFLLIASFNIYGLISLTSLEKVREVAILRCLGLSSRRIAGIFLLKAVLLGLSGAMIGGVMGLGTVWFFQRHPIPLPPSYYVEFLPLVLNLRQSILFIALAPVVAVIAALYPALQVSRGSPVEVLRYE